MRITTELVIDDAGCNELARILKCSVRNLPGRLALYASAAIEEYVSMFRGQKVFTRGSDITEYRLFLLITKAMGNSIPGEQDVCSLFQTSTTESRALIRAVMSKYQYSLRDAVNSSMKQIIRDARQNEEDGTREVTVDSLNIVEELNRLLATIDGALRPITRKRGSVSTYEISPASYARLDENLNANE